MDDIRAPALKAPIAACCIPTVNVSNFTLYYCLSFYSYKLHKASVNIQNAHLQQKNEVCVVLEPYPEWRTMDAVDEDEQSESSEDNTGQLKSEVRAKRQL